MIVYPVLSYADILVQSGYPLVAATPEHVRLLLRRLVASPELRQQASELGLAVARRLTTQAVAAEFAAHVCGFLEGAGGTQWQVPALR